MRKAADETRRSWRRKLPSRGNAEAVRYRSRRRLLPPLEDTLGEEAAP